jgi:hypothetical protein
LAGAFGFNQRYGAIPSMIDRGIPKNAEEKIAVLGVEAVDVGVD